jgi:DNA-binding SARP family transcriptional activator
MTPDPCSGLDERGEWSPAFPGQRPPLRPGNEVSVRHGAYAVLRLQPRAEEVRDEIAGLVPFASDADGAILDLLSITLAQVERAGIVLAYEQSQSARSVENGEEPSPRLDRLAADTRAWVNTAAKLLDQLGMSPTARVRLAGDLAGAQRALTAASLREHYGATEQEEAA